jgi:uncharacterized protein (TIGR00299 family) protein
VIGWLDLSSGASGDMLLGALVDAGVPLALMQAEIDRFALPIELTTEPVTRAGLAATRVHVMATELDSPRRTLAEVVDLVRRLSPSIAAAAERTFRLLAAAEAKVHGIPESDVHFHEVGALDALADVTGVCAGFASLGLSSLTAGPFALGGGSVSTEHGELPVPGPAVLAVLAETGAITFGGGGVELCTPTGAALVASQATAYGPLPPMRLIATGSGAGARDQPGRPNILRLTLGEAAAALPAEGAVVLAANVDDLDPRAWPLVLAALLSTGADDAWLTPILMKKGRPAHVVQALVPAERADAVRAALFRETSTLGIRATAVTKTPLEREFAQVEVDGQPIAVKIARAADGGVLNAMPEWDDVVRAAAALGRPVKRVLAQAQAAYEVAAG